MKHKLTILICCLCILQSVPAQTSWQRWVHDYLSYLVVPMEDGGLISTGFLKNSLNIGLVRLDSQGNLLWSRRLVLEDSLIFKAFYTTGLAILDNEEIAVSIHINQISNIAYNANICAVLDKNGAIIKSTLLSNHPILGLSNILFVTKDNNIVAADENFTTQNERFLHVDFLKNDLSLIWSKQYLTDFGIYHNGFPTQTLTGDFIFSGILDSLNLKAGFAGGFVVKIDPNGAVKVSKKFPTCYVHDLIELTSGEYLTMAIDSGFQNSGDTAPIYLAKLDSNFNPIWCKKLPSVGFDLNIHSLSPSSDGGFYLKYYPFVKALPQLSRYDGNGNPVWQRRYSTCQNLNILANNESKDGSLVGIFFTDSYEYVLYKMTPDGHLGSCPDQETPINLLDVPFLPMEDLAWKVQNASLLLHKKLLSIPIQLILEDFCPSNNFPLAHFEMPDTVCRNVKLQPTYDGNGIFDNLSWHFENGMPDSSNLTAAIESQIDSAGNHLILLVQQFGACADTFQKIVTVISTQIDLGQDTSFCDGQTVTFQPPNLSDFKFFEWENGSNTPTRTIAQTQLVAIRATTMEGCIAMDTVLVSSVPIPDFLPSDTTACTEKTAFTKIPDNFSGNIIWNGNSVAPGNLLPLLEGENKLEATTVGGCEWSEILRFLPKNCAVNIYAPNVFSPNGDGQNEEFRLYSSPGVTKIRAFQIFDRFGELLFEVHGLAADDPKIAWDGSFRGKKCAPQVFVWWAEIETSDGQIAILKGDFLLVN